MMRTSLKAAVTAALIGVAALSLPVTAEAGHGWGGPGWHGGGYWGPRGGYWGPRGGYWGPGWGWGAGAAGLAVGAAIGAALAPPPVVVAPPPPAPVAYGGAYVAPPPWTPEWYTYCKQQYRSFNARTGYFTGYDGLPHFCQ